MTEDSEREAGHQGLRLVSHRNISGIAVHIDPHSLFRIEIHLPQVPQLCCLICYRVIGKEESDTCEGAGLGIVQVKLIAQRGPVVPPGEQVGLRAPESICGLVCIAARQHEGGRSALKLQGTRVWVDIAQARCGAHG